MARCPYPPPLWRRGRSEVRLPHAFELPRRGQRGDGRASGLSNEVVRGPRRGVGLASREMSTFGVLVVQFTSSLVAFTLLARWHVAPRLSSASRETALVPLLWVQVFRYAPLALYATGQVDSRIPSDVAAAVGLGDLVSGVVALGALIAVKHRARGATAIVWVFTVVGIADLIFATLKAVGARMFEYYMGWNWYILNFYVPMLVVSHVMIVQRLLDRREADAAVPRVAP